MRAQWIDSHVPHSFAVWGLTCTNWLSVQHSQTHCGNVSIEQLPSSEKKSRARVRTMPDSGHVLATVLILQATLQPITTLQHALMPPPMLKHTTLMLQKILESTTTAAAAANSRACCYTTARFDWPILGACYIFQHHRSLLCMYRHFYILLVPCK